MSRSCTWRTPGPTPGSSRAGRRRTAWRAPRQSSQRRPVTARSSWCASWAGETSRRTGWRASCLWAWVSWGGRGWARWRRPRGGCSWWAALPPPCPGTARRPHPSSSSQPRRPPSCTSYSSITQPCNRRQMTKMRNRRTSVVTSCDISVSDKPSRQGRYSEGWSSLDHFKNKTQLSTYWFNFVNSDVLFSELTTAM